MPYKIQILNFLEIVLVNTCNFLLLIVWKDVIYCIPLILSAIYSFGRMKAQVVNYHNGSWIKYFKFIFYKK